MDYLAYINKNKNSILWENPLYAFDQALNNPPWKKIERELGLLLTGRTDRFQKEWDTLIPKMNKIRQSQQPEDHIWTALHHLFGNIKELNKDIENHLSNIASTIELITPSESALVNHPEGLQYESLQDIKSMKEDAIKTFTGTPVWEEIQMDLIKLDAIISSLERLEGQRFSYEQWKVLLGRQELQYKKVHDHLWRLNNGYFKPDIFQVQDFAWSPYAKHNYDYYLHFRGLKKDVLQQCYVSIKEAKSNLIERESKNAEMQFSPLYQRLIKRADGSMNFLRQTINTQQYPLAAWIEQMEFEHDKASDWVAKMKAYNASQEVWKYEDYRILNERYLFYANPLKSLDLMMDFLKDQTVQWANTAYTNSDGIKEAATIFAEQRGQLRQPIDELEDTELPPTEWPDALDSLANRLKALKQDQEAKIQELTIKIVGREPQWPVNQGDEFTGVLNMVRSSYHVAERKLTEFRETELHKKDLEALQLLLGEIEVYNENIMLKDICDEAQLHQLAFFFSIRFDPLGKRMRSVLACNMIPVPLDELRFSLFVNDDPVMTWRERRCYRRWPKAPTTDYILQMRRALVSAMKQLEQEYIDPAPALENLLIEAEHLLEELDKLWKSEQKMSEWQPLENKLEDEAHKLLAKLKSYDPTNEQQAMITGKLERSLTLMQMVEDKYGKL